MAEVLGAIASVLTLSHLVAEGINQLIELYRAPDEIKALQDQVRAFHDVVQAAETNSDISTHDAMFRALARAKHVIEQLNALINGKLIRQGRLSDRTRHRAWVNNKRKITRLRKNLMDAKEHLLDVLNIRLVFSVQQVQSSLDRITCQPSFSCSATLNIGRRLENIERTLRRDNSILTDDNGARDLPATSALMAFERASFLDKIADSGSDRPVEECPPHMHRKALMGPEENPSSSFELLASYRPETYTAQDTIKRLYGYHGLALEASKYTRINNYALFYLLAPRQWIRLTISITTSIDSPFWNIFRDGSAAFSPKGFKSVIMPATVLTILQGFLVDHLDDLGQDSHLNIFLGNISNAQHSVGTIKCPIEFAQAIFSAEAYLRDITSMVAHLGCPKYSHRDLDQRPLSKHNPNFCFITFLHSEWVHEIRFGSDKLQIDDQLYIMQLMHCLNGSPGISRFHGVVVDDFGVISAFLTELPAKGKLARIMGNAKRSGQPVSWQRREKWCRQIVQSVAQVHSKGFLVGFLAESPIGGIAIDGNDEAKLHCRFRKCFTYDGITPEILPPEYRQTIKEEATIAATPYSDLYHLGLLLSRIAWNADGRFRTKLHQLVQGEAADDSRGAKSRENMNSSEASGERIPQYMADIIAACSAENPIDRKPAWKLLEMFSSTIQCTEHIVEGAPEYSSPMSTACQMASSKTTNRLVRLEECLDGHDHIVLCDICGVATSEHVFSCNICVSGDYDICPRCFNHGGHCLDPDHYLLEQSYATDEERYHSRVKENGQRDVKDL